MKKSKTKTYTEKEYREKLERIRKEEKKKDYKSKYLLPILIIFLISSVLATSLIVN